MKAPKNRRVFVIGYGTATPLGKTFKKTWERAVRGEAGFRKVTRCHVKSLSNVVGEIPDWDPRTYDFSSEKEVYNWNAAFVILTMAVCKEALENSGLQMDKETGPRTACLTRKYPTHLRPTFAKLSRSKPHQTRAVASADLEIIPMSSFRKSGLSPFALRLRIVSKGWIYIQW